MTTKRAKKTKVPVFDKNKPRAVNMKVRCAAPASNQYGYDIGNTDKCGAVYLRIVENEDNPTPMDLRTTHVKCPICGSEKFENLTNWELSADRTRVLIKSENPI
jgi:hypothetical protein